MKAPAGVSGVGPPNLPGVRPRGRPSFRSPTVLRNFVRRLQQATAPRIADFHGTAQLFSKMRAPCRSPIVTANPTRIEVIKSRMTSFATCR
jgi:hypothetical protein